MIMDTLGALALATEPPNDDMMKRPPVGRKGNFISNVMWRNILGQALYQFAIIWFLQTRGKVAFHLEGPETDLTLNTLIFNSFVFCQVKFDLRDIGINSVYFSLHQYGYDSNDRNCLDRTYIHVNNCFGKYFL